jgi:SAM-dependent methyltransferase
MEPVRIRYVACPLCGSKKIQKVFDVIDYTVSGTSFELDDCAQCTLRFTQGIPDALNIQSYYRSENYISHSDTREGLTNRLYHLARKRTLSNKRRLLQHATGLRQGSLLDVGAGSGAFVHYMKAAGWSVTGLEPDAPARNKAMEVNQVHLLPIDHLFHLPEKSFDAITLWHVLEHVHDLHGYIQQLERMLKPTGRIFIAVPNYTSYDAALYKQFWAAYDVPRHLYHFSPASMNKLLDLHHLKLEKMQPMWFDSFYISLLSGKYKTGRENRIIGFLNGMLSNINALLNRVKCSSLTYIVRQ